MKLKHLLLSALLTTVAAVTLLTLVLPQPAEAAPPTYDCYNCSGGVHTKVHSRKEALRYCESMYLRCVNPRNGNEVCNSCP